MFRSLKSELGLRPVFHRKEVCAEGHPFITAVAYQLAQVVRSALRTQGVHASWGSHTP